MRGAQKKGRLALAATRASASRADPFQRGLWSNRVAARSAPGCDLRGGAREKAPGSFLSLPPPPKRRGRALASTRSTIVPYTLIAHPNRAPQTGRSMTGADDEPRAQPCGASFFGPPFPFRDPAVTLAFRPCPKASRFHLSPARVPTFAGREGRVLRATVAPCRDEPGIGLQFQPFHRPQTTAGRRKPAKTRSPRNARSSGAWPRPPWTR
jgi:hypothetical protein